MSRTPILSALDPSRMRLAWALLLGISVLLMPATASARRSTDVGYRYRQVWTAVVRMVRIDYGYQILERDEDVGFVMFEYRNGERTHSGSIEVLENRDSLGRDRVRVVVTIAGQPSYVEAMMVTRLERKLRQDFGRPVEAETRREESAAASEDEDEEEGDQDGDTREERTES